ncbi:MAG: alpha-mannosidase, partial [Abditibacteriota bacterium]|nr:alpha-mannosidase [Abditibacteriota bacterium]
MEKRAILPISNQVFSKLSQIQQRYSDLRYEKLCEVPMQYTELKDVHYRQAPLGEPGVEFRDAPKGTKWGGDWITAWFCGSVTVPAAADGRKLFVRANTDGETLFIANGEYKGVFDANHPVRLVTLSAREGDRIDLAFEAYSGHFCPNCMPTDSPTYVEDKCKTFGGTELLLEREDVSEFVYDFMTLRMLLTAMDPNSLRRNVILRELVKVYNIVDMYPGEKGEASWRPKLREADAILKELLSKKNGETMPYMGIVGHSHMDTAWLWPLRETWRKCARTFSSALSLMDEYPEFTFVQSSPAQTEKIKELYPSIFEGIQKRVAEGRYEPNGGMWVEPDCNIPSGEALARQLIMAQKYTMKWFGYKANTLWMPDVFGYSGTLPQLLRLADMPYFCTTKIAWNDTTRHPYDTF